MKPCRPACITSCKFIPKPSPTTDACNRNFDNFLDELLKGWENSSPNARPMPRATGGDANPLAAASRPMTNIILAIITWGATPDGTSDYKACVRETQRDRRRG